MKRAAPFALVLSLLLNAVLLVPHGKAKETPAAEGPHPVHVGPSGRDLPATAPDPAPVKGEGPELAEVRARIPQLRKDEAALQAELDMMRGMDPMRLRMLSVRPLAEKLRDIAALPKRDSWWPAIQELSAKLGRDADRVEQIVDVLAREDDPRALLVLRDLLAAMNTNCSPEGETTQRVIDWIRRGEPVERRAAAARFFGLFPLSAAPEEFREAIAQSLRSDPDPDVARALCEAMARRCGNDLTPAIVSGLRAAADRLPEGDGRREVLTTLGFAAIPTDGAQELYDRWRTASSAGLREEIAGALAEAGCRCGFRAPDPTLPDLSGTLTTRRNLVVEIYSARLDPRTRARLLVATAAGLGLVDRPDAESAKFLRDLAARDPDPQRQDRLRSFADRMEQGVKPVREEWLSLGLGQK